MIPADVINTLKALALTQKPLVTGADPVAAKVGTTFEPGQKHQGLVQAQVAPGIFKVQVAEQVLQMQLPANIRAGDKITLQVVSLIPRLTFTMAASANPLSTPDQLSSTARLLSSLSQQPVEKSYVRPAQSAPLWTGKMQFPDTVELAGKLHEALSQSGLFYESHQAQWVQGSRSTAQLLHEPQNLPPAHQAQTREAAARSANSGGRSPLGQPEQAASRLSAGENAPVQPAGSQQATGISGGDERNAAASIPEHLHPIVQQQLNALETRQVHWQGQVWPNQEMHWEIHEESARKPNGEEERQWATQIQLDLPNLGEVTARLRFGSGGLILSLDASNEATRAVLGKASARLVSALGERGIATASTTVTQHGNP